MKRSYLTIGAIFKNEAPYLDEWINHYLSRGIEHFYLINDESTDESIKVLEKYNKNITIFDVEENLIFYGRQKYLYNKFFSNLKDELEWMLICDIDEYIWSPKRKDIRETLQELNKENIRTLRIPMVLFGSNNHIKQPDSIVKSFTKRIKVDEFYFNWVDKYYSYKTIFQINEILEFDIHTPAVKTHSFREDSLDLNDHYLRYNHYRLQSKEKWERETIKKSDVNHFILSRPDNFSPNLKDVKMNASGNYKTMKLFYEANKVQNEVEDFDLVHQI